MAVQPNYRGYNPVTGDDIWTITGALNIASGGEAVVESGGKIRVESGGETEYESGSSLKIEGGATLGIESLGTLAIESGGLFTLALGTVLNFATGDVSLTHSAGKLTLTTTWAEVGRVGRPFGVELTITGNMGNYVNALKGYVDASNGGSIGLLSAVNCEIKMPSGACAGAFYPLEVEWVGQAGTSFGAPGTGSQSGFLYLAASGTVTDLDSDGVFMSLNGLTAGATKLLSLDMHTLKCTVDNGTYAKYLVLSEAENMILHTFSALTVGDAYSGLRILVTAPAAHNEYGMSAYFQTDITGTTAGHCYGVGSWINTSSTPVLSAGHIIVPFEGGVYTGEAQAAARIVFAGQHQAILTGAPASLHAWRLNTSQTITALIAAANPGSVAFQSSAAETSTPIGSVPMFDIVGTGIGYVRLYDDYT